MIEESSGSVAEFDPLLPTIRVYRALRKGWIDNDNSIVKADAYYLRQRINEQGLSVNFSIERALTALRNCDAVASITVASIRELGLDVVRDSSSHGTIIGLPYREDDRKRADELAILLARQSRIVWRSQL